MSPLPIPFGAAGVRERRRRIARIEAQVRAGTYRVPAGAVAAAVLRFHRRGP
jgi:anti-sigma28 factor (negative regulator of flagellin synthesis)